MEISRRRQPPDPWWMGDRPGRGGGGGSRKFHRLAEAESFIHAGSGGFAAPPANFHDASGVQKCGTHSNRAGNARIHDDGVTFERKDTFERKEEDAHAHTEDVVVPP